MKQKHNQKISKKINQCFKILVASLMLASLVACEPIETFSGDSSSLSGSENSKITERGESSKAETSKDSSENNSEDSSSIDESKIPQGRADDLKISEAMSNNDCFWTLKYEDWIEIYNPSQKSVSLSKYRISDDGADVTKYALPDITINAGEYKVILCSDLGFSLSKSGESVYLYNAEEKALSSKLDLEVSEKNKSFTEDGVCDYPTPAFENTYEGYLAYRDSLKQTLIINEIIASNSTVYAVSGEYYDLIELKNVSNTAINLSDYYISDDKNALLAYRLPDVTLKAGGMYVVAADGVNVPFKLSSSGDAVYLTYKDGLPKDALCFESCPAEVSFGVSGNELVYFSKPSFGKENGNGEVAITAEPVPSVPSGMYENAFTLTFSGEGNMYYTTDGSEPTESSMKYSEKIVVDGNATVRIKAFDGNKIPSKTVTCSYFINETSALPVLKISAKDSDIWSSDSGIYANPKKSWTKEINLSFFVDGKEEFNVDCGLAMFGSTGRNESKKSFKVKFRGKYGASKLEYKLFDNLSITSFTDLVIRGGSQDWYFSGVRDEVATSLALSADTSLLVQSYRPVVLYINGEYMGIYFIRERINEDFVASHHNTSPDDAALVVYGYRLDAGTEEDMADWNALVKFMKNNDMKKAENYEYVCKYLDVESLADWYIFRGYAGDRDIDNIRYYRESKDAKWKLIFYDLDLGFWGTKQPLTKITGSSSDYSSFNVPIRMLKVNSEFRKLFMQRLEYHAENTLADEYVLARIDEIGEMIKEDIPENNARWEPEYIADGKGTYFNYNFWVSQMNYLKKIVKNGSHSRIELLKDDAESVFG